jgi:hypothetical protein
MATGWLPQTWCVTGTCWMTGVLEITRPTYSACAANVAPVAKAPTHVAKRAFFMDDSL